jgi:hypothetical protein
MNVRSCHRKFSRQFSMGFSGSGWLAKWMPLLAVCCRLLPLVARKKFKTYLTPFGARARCEGCSHGRNIARGFPELVSDVGDGRRLAAR